MPKTKLTNQMVKGTKPPETGRVDYQDEIVPGLILRVSTSGRKSYSVSYWQRGKRPRVTLGDASLLSLAEAREQAREILRNVKLGLDPAREKRDAREADTFAELAGRYVERWAKVRKAPKGAREDEIRIEKVLIPRWGSWSVGDVRKRDVVALLDEYVDRGTPYAANRMQALVSKIFAFGVERDEVEGNPVAGIRRQPEDSRKRVLTDAELRTLLPLFRNEGLVGLGFRLLLLTAQRPGEVFGAPWSEFDGDVWALPKARTKNRHSRKAPEFHIVPLSREARSVVRELRSRASGSDFLFPTRMPGRGKPFLSHLDAYRSIKENAGLSEDWRIYDLRSAALTGMQDTKVPPHVLSAIANHVSGSITLTHYALHNYADEKREALDRWGAHVEKLDPATKADVVELRR